MASIPGTVSLTGAIAPNDSEDTYPTHFAKYGKGGYYSVATLDERNAIPLERLEEGLLVYVVDQDKTYVYKSGQWEKWGVSSFSSSLQSIPVTVGEAVADNFFVAANGYDHPDVSSSYKAAAVAVKNARTDIINAAYDTFFLPAGESETTCRRDIGYVVDAIAADLGNSNDDPLFRSNLYSIQAGKAYYELDGTRRIGINEVAPSKIAFSSVASQIIALIGSSFATYVNSLRDIINGYLDNGLNWAAAPELRYGIQRGRFIDGSNLIRANRDYIIDRVLTNLQAAPYNYILPSGTKCRRDLNFVIDAAIADIRNLSNVNAIAVGYKYYEDGELVIGTSDDPSELTKTVAAFRLARDYCMQAIQNKLPNTSNFAEVDGELNLPAISAGGAQFEGSECASVASAAYSIFNIIIGYLENGLDWADAPKRKVGLIEKELPGQSWRTAFASIKRALAEVAKFPEKECTVRVSSGKFYEDNPLIIPQPKTAVIGDNLRTTTICPLNHGQDLFKIDSGTYLNYMVFEDNYRGGFGILDSSNQVNPREMSATATTLRLFPGHTIKDTPGRFKDAANLVRANRLYIDAQVIDYNALPIIDAVIADLRIMGNINSIEAIAVNNPTKITQTKDLILSAIRGDLPNSEANQTSGTDFNSLNPGGVNYDTGDCANVESAAATLVDLISAIAAGNPPPKANTGTLLLVNQEWMQIASLNGNDLVIGSRGVFNTTATRHISGSKCTQNAKAFRYAAAFKDGVNIFLSPYIQNCSNISVLGRTVLKSDGSGELDDTKTLAGGILVDGGVLANTSPIASMVMDAFTQIVSGSVGFHHKRNGYSQLVSVFQVFEDIGILCESGAYTSVTNSATNFGNYALKAVGFSDTTFPFYEGTLVGAENVNLGFNNTPSNIFESTFANAGNNQTRVTLTLEADKIGQFVVGQTITVAGHSVAAANGTGLLVTNVQASDRTISYIVDIPFGSGIAAGGQTGTVTITQGRQVTRLSISGFTSIPLPNYVVKVRILGTSNFYTRTDELEYIVEEATPFNNSGITVVTLQVLWEGALPGNTAIELRRPSTINSSSHTFEFIGSGINYTALPENGGVTDPQTQTVEVNSGRVYCSATDQDGNFTVGPFFNVDLKSGKVTFTGTVSLGVIDEIQLKNSPGVPIREFSIDTDLSGDTGAANTRIPTQRAIRDFVKNKLGNLFDKTSGTSGGGSSFAGQLVELTQQGFISETQLPPRSPFNIFNVANQAERLALTNVNQGDYAAQADTGVVYVLKTIANGGASVDDNWAILPSGVTSASSIAGVIPVTNLGSGTANASTFLAGDSSYKPVVRSLLSGNESVVIGTDAITPGTYPTNSKVGDITVTVNTVGYSQGQTSGASTLGVAKFDYTDFDISNGVVSIKNEAVDLNEIAHVPGNSVLGNNSGTTGVVRSLPLNDVVATVPTIAVSFSGSTYSIAVNGVSLGSNPVLTLTKGQTYKFNLNVTGHGFNITTTSGTVSGNLYSTGLIGTNGTQVTNDSTKFIWTVPLNAPNTLFYQDGVTLTNFGVINLTGGAIASTEKGANNGVATLDSNGKVPQTQLTIVGTTNRIAVNSTTNAIDLATVSQTDTNGVAGINFVQSVSKDTYGRITGRVLADIRTATTSQTGIVQLNSSITSTSETEAATPLAVKAYVDSSLTDMAKTNTSQQFEGFQGSLREVQDISGDVIIDGRLSNIYDLTVTGNVTSLTFTNLQSGKYIINIIQGSVPYSVSLNPSVFKAAEESTPVSTEAYKKSKLIGDCDGSFIEYELKIWDTQFRESFSAIWGLIISEINSERTALGQSVLNSESQNLIKSKIKFLNGEATAWSVANGLTPVNVFNKIVLSVSLSSAVNVGSGSSAVMEVGISGGIPTIAPVNAKATLGADYTWDTFFSGVPAQNDSVIISTQGLNFTHGASGDGITAIITGFNATSDLWAATGQAGAGQGNRVLAFQDNPTSLKGYNSSNGLSILGWRGATFRDTQGLIWDHNLGGDELAQFSSAYWQGATALGMRNGTSFNQNLRTRNAGDTYTQQETPINPHELRMGKLISGYSANNPNFVACPSYIPSVIILKGYPTQTEIDNLLRGMLQFEIDAHTLGLSANQFRIISTSTDANGIINHNVISRKAGFVRIRVKPPTSPAAGKPPRYCYLLEATTIPAQTSFGVGIEHCTVTESYHNDYNMTFIEVDFPDECWYADHPTYAHQRWESFYDEELIPWVENNFGTPGDKRVLIGFSKSGWGALTKIFRNQSLYSAAACFDAPLYSNTIDHANFFSAGTFTFGTQANLDTYYPPTLATNNAANFTSTNRIWISRGTGGGPAIKFSTDMQNFTTHLTNLGIQHTYSLAGTSHAWSGGWTDGAMAFLDTASL